MARAFRPALAGYRAYRLPAGLSIVLPIAVFHALPGKGQPYDPKRYFVKVQDLPHKQML